MFEKSQDIILLQPESGSFYTRAEDLEDLAMRVFCAGPIVTTPFSLMSWCLSPFFPSFSSSCPHRSVFLNTKVQCHPSDALLVPGCYKAGYSVTIVSHFFFSFF